MCIQYAAKKTAGGQECVVLYCCLFLIPRLTVEAFAVLFLLAQPIAPISAQDVMKLGKSIEFITFILSGGVACV